MSSEAHPYRVDKTGERSTKQMRQGRNQQSSDRGGAIPGRSSQKKEVRAGNVRFLQTPCVPGTSYMRNRLEGRPYGTGRHKRKRKKDLEDT